MPATISPELAPEVKLSTASEFLDWLEPGLHADLIGGEIFMHSPASLRDADLLNLLHTLMALYIERKGAGKLYREVIAVKFDQRNVFMPDLAYFTPEQVPKLGPVYISETPALVVEALSPSSAARDTGMKFAAYEAHGVQEYWIVDPISQDHHFFRLEGDLSVEVDERAEVVRSQALPGFWLKRSWLDAAALPRLEDCLREVRANAAG
jgi:Uma2 family endonuclease